MSLNAHQLLGKSQPDLDALFSAHEAGPIPDGEADGTAIIAPGTPFSPAIAAVINIFAWKGKVFDAKAGFLRNEILPFGLKAIVARVYKAPSWLDGKECIVLDHSRPRWSPSTSGTRSASSILVSTSAKSIGIRSG